MLHFSIFLLAVLVFATEFSQYSSKLLYVQMVFRHGDRSPIELYKNDPNPMSFWPEGLGVLSPLGKIQQFCLGKYFRSLYKDFSSFEPQEVYACSSAEPRCLESCKANLAGFFAPNSSLEEALKNQPIQVNSVPKEQDNLLTVKATCPKAEAETKTIEDSPETKTYLDQQKEMFQTLSESSGQEIKTALDASKLRDTLFIEKKYGRTIPNWVDPYWDKLNEVTNWSYRSSFSTPLMQKLRAGPLLQKLIENMQKKVDGNLENRKFKFLSTHDTTLVVLMLALDLFDDQQPPYCATLLFELHEQSNQQKAVRILYCNSAEPEKQIDDPKPLVLKGCEEYCPLDKFVEYTKDKIPVDWNKECNS